MHARPVRAHATLTSPTRPCQKGRGKQNERRPKQSIVRINSEAKHEQASRRAGTHAGERQRKSYCTNLSCALSLMRAWIIAVRAQCAQRVKLPATTPSASPRLREERVPGEQLTLGRPQLGALGVHPHRLEEHLVQLDLPLLAGQPP